MSYKKCFSMVPNKSPLKGREIRIQESSSAIAARSSALLKRGGCSDTERSRFEVSAPTNPNTACLKLRRHNGDRGCRGEFESNGQPRSVSSKQNGAAKAAGTVNRFLLVLLLFLQTGSRSSGWAEAAYLNGVNSELSNRLPPRTTTPKQPRSTTKNKRYAFASRPMDKYFTATGTLPPLPPSPFEDDPKAPWFPAATRSTTSEDAVTVTYTNDPDTVDSWLCHNVPYDGCFLGFDIERLPECRSKNPDSSDRSDFAHAAVVQLATTSACLVVHLVDSGSTVSSEGRHHNYPRHSNACARILRAALEDTSIVKAGCSIDEDLVLLHELWGGPRESDSVGVRTSGKRDGIAEANGLYDASQNEPKALRGGVTGSRRTNHRQHHHGRPFDTGSEKGAVVKTMRDRHRDDPIKNKHHGLSLRARSRFDLGCVVLSREKGNASARDDANDGGCGRHNKRAETTKGDSQYPPHFKIVAKKATSIQNKSGLQGLCKTVLGIDLPKEEEDCKSDWTRFPLTDDQITYAARDAWAGVAIATELASISASRTGGSSDNKNRNKYKSKSKNDHPMQVRAGQQHGTSNIGTQGNDVFSLSNLIRVLGKSETPLPHLAERHRQRKKAKSELQSLLNPYAKNQFLNQHNHRRHQELLVLRQNQPTNGTNIATTTTATNSIRNDKIDVQALFAGYPLSSQRTLAHYGQKQHQLMEKSLPKRVRKRSLVLRQMVNARVIDHKVVFEIKIVRPDEHDAAATAAGNRKKQRHRRHNPRSRWRRNRKELGASEPESPSSTESTRH
mmetsp:Transcript_11928/g.28289  ORF Transcript_11928/g.28289 Transcript_11928/m.28289 type:complete len:786 (-) Transcript_11928:691-3048(-)